MSQMFETIHSRKTESRIKRQSKDESGQYEAIQERVICQTHIYVVNELFDSRAKSNSFGKNISRTSWQLYT